MFAAVNGTSIYYETVGFGSPILLMHGGLGPDHSYLRPWFDSLTDRNIEVTYYDHRSGGRSERVSTFEGITHDTLTADADQLRSVLGHGRLTLLGHSYGGMLAMEYALRYAEHLNGLILCCTAPSWDYVDETVTNAEARGGATEMAALERLHRRDVTDDDTFGRLTANIQALYFKGPDKALIEEMHQRTVYSAAAYELSEILLEGFDISNRLSDITVPTLVIAGGDDWVTPQVQSERMANLIPNAELVAFENSGHYPFIEEHDRFVRVVADWVGSLA